MTGTPPVKAPNQIKKRDGCVETWAVDRIAAAIGKALKASGIVDPLLSKRLARKVESKLSGSDIFELTRYLFKFKKTTYALKLSPKKELYFPFPFLFFSTRHPRVLCLL